MKLFEIKDVDAHYIVYILQRPILKIRHKIRNFDARRVEAFGLNTEPREQNIIVSLTSFPARIKKVHFVIENLLTQTIKPDKLILWLSDSEFPNREKDLPESLLRLREFGLTISWCEYMRSFQKLIPTLREYSNDIIITLDDDFYYPQNIIEDLYSAYLKNPSYIYANRTWRGYIKNSEFNMVSTNTMFTTKFPEPSYYNLLMGYGGVLYPPHCLDPEVLNIQKFREIIPTHDDVWFWAMSVLGKTKTCQVRGYDLSICTIEDTQQFGLCNINKPNSEGIDAAVGINKLICEYPKLLDILKEEENEWQK